MSKSTAGVLFYLYEQKISFKVDGCGSYGNGDKYFFLYIKLLVLQSCHHFLAYHVTFQLAKNILWM